MGNYHDAYSQAILTPEIRIEFDNLNSKVTMSDCDGKKVFSAGLSGNGPDDLSEFVNDWLRREIRSARAKHLNFRRQASHRCTCHHRCQNCK